MKRKIIFTIHSIAGLLSGLFILLISLSGAILVFHNELDRLEYPKVNAEENKNLASIDNCFQILQKQYPHAQVINCRLPVIPTDPFIFTFYDSAFHKGTDPTQLFLHSQRGTILKTRSARNNFVNWVAILHNSFHLGKRGEWLFGFFAAVLILSTLTGLILYRRNIVAVLAFKRHVWKWKNLHQLVGVYALLFNLMIGVTGFWMQRYVFKKEFYQASSYTPVFTSSPSMFFSLDSALNDVTHQYPDFTPYVIYFAQSKKGKTAIYGSRRSNSFIHSKDFADALFLDSAGKVSSTAFVNEIDASNRYDIINAQVHFGQYGGLPVKIIYCLFGLTSGLLSITGFLLWLKRNIRKSQ